VLARWNQQFWIEVGPDKIHGWVITEGESGVQTEATGGEVGDLSNTTISR
jgi:hypothetical protein